MFESKRIDYRNVISNISIIGFEENDILKFGKDIYSKGILLNILLIFLNFFL